MKKSINIILLLAIIIVLVSFKKKEYNKPITSCLPAVGEKIDPETPADAQPLVLGNDNKPMAAVTTQMAPNGYKLDFSDEFNAQNLNLKKWNISESNTSRQSRPKTGVDRWFWKKDMVAMSGTDLILKASKFNEGTMYCGVITSQSQY